jgi:hypothetical protein
LFGAIVVEFIDYHVIKVEEKTLEQVAPVHPVVCCKIQRIVENVRVRNYRHRFATDAAVFLRVCDQPVEPLAYPLMNVGGR